MELKIKLIENGKCPVRKHETDAGIDCYARDCQINWETGIVKYPLGFSMEIPDGYVGLVFPRSSVKDKTLCLANCVGVVDSSYRGEVVAVFRITDRSKRELYPIGDRVCQIIIMPYPKVDINVVDELSSTERGEGGFGSTGNN